MSSPLESLMIARVAVEKANYDFDALYDYLIPDALKETICVGYRVIVPFGNGKKGRQGFVFEIERSALPLPDKRYKEIRELCDDGPLLTEKSVALAERIAERTFCTMFEAAKAMLPAGLCLAGKPTYCREAYPDEKTVEALSPDERAVYDAIPSADRFVGEETLLKKFGLAKDNPILPKLLKKKLIYLNVSSASFFDGKTRRTAVLREEADVDSPAEKLTAKQRSVLEVLRDAGSAAVSELCYFTGVTASVVLALERKGLIELRDVHYYSEPSAFYAEEGVQTPIELTDEQQTAFESLRTDLFSGRASCSLLFGVTGSGKTSVYLRLIDEALPTGRGIILMVPEISLTPQTLQLFYSRYGKHIAVFHSGLSATERADEWRRVRSGEAQIAVGTRSAVFAPFEQIGLIIVDEEQEHTYKSSRSPRYNAIEVAKYLCGRDRSLLVLSSATPSMNSFSRALSGRFKLLKLTKRYGGALLPHVEVVDISGMPHDTALSDKLRSMLQENLDAGKQSILLMNRRGFNTFAVCSECKNVVSCPSCSISLTYHAANRRLMCHYCGYSVPYTAKCPTCGGEAIRYSGFGTQRVEEELHQLFPKARVLRMDADTTMAKNSHEELLRSFGRGEYDIMVGTQMVAKGLDFPNVTLTGVISADMGIFKDDYRSAERSFDLLTQVVGRAGRRGEQGLAIIQTVTPENKLVALSASQDYEAFYTAEIENRRLMIYPPFCDLCVVGFSSPLEASAKSAAYRFLQNAQTRVENEYRDVKIIAIGPAPSFIRKLGNKFRYKIIIKCKNSLRFRAMLRGLLIDAMKDKENKDVGIFADIDPAEIF